MNGKIDVEVFEGRVMAVWHGCQLLPFEQHDIEEARAGECGGNPPATVEGRIDVRPHEPA